MRKSIVKVIQPIIILCLLCLLVWATAFVLRRNESYAKNHDFYSDETDCDVFFLGSSHTVMGVLPMELWNEYGITSYNLANNGQWCAGDYWVLRNALDERTPQLVVLDAYAVFADEKHAEGHMDYLHESFDPIPFSLTKLEAIRDTFAEENQAEFIFPFTTYHNRWEYIDSSYFERTPSYQKGAYENASTELPFVLPYEENELIPISQSNETETISKTYLRRSIELCQERGIPVLLTVTPFHASEELQEWVNSVYGIAEAYDVPFINGLQEDVIDMQCDLWDEGHLNSSGARKWTAYIGNYITENYDISDKRTDEAYAKWNTDYANYRMYEVHQLQNAESLNAFLMLLQDDTFDYCITVREDSSLYGDETFWNLLANAGADVEPATDVTGSTPVINQLSNAPETIWDSPGNSWDAPESPDWEVQILVSDPSTGCTFSRYW